MSEEGQDESLLLVHTLEMKKKTKNFISPTEVAGRQSMIEWFCEQFGTSIHVGFNRARERLKPYCSYVCFDLCVCVCWLTTAVGWS